mmetsp:Transcript_54261/g.144763  ORF Transcript_54261/g.144763 Transcript_54261/m.144763 type:complete len:295 (-) Transcript_54261:949-1833(-)
MERTAVHVRMVEEKNRIIRGSRRIFEVRAVGARLPSDPLVCAAVNHCVHQAQASDNASFCAPIPIVPIPIQIRALPKIVASECVGITPETHDHGLCPRARGSTQHTDLRPCERRYNGLPGSGRVDVQGEIACDWPVLESTVDHLASRPSARAASEVIFREYRGLHNRSIPIGQSQNARIHTQQCILELQRERSVPGHEHWPTVSLIPSQVTLSHCVLHHKIVVRPETRAIGSNTIRLGGRLHDPHRLDHLLPLISTQRTHLFPLPLRSRRLDSRIADRTLHRRRHRVSRHSQTK